MQHSAVAVYGSRRNMNAMSFNEILGFLKYCPAKTNAMQPDEHTSDASGWQIEQGGCGHTER